VFTVTKVAVLLIKQHYSTIFITAARDSNSASEALKMALYKQIYNFYIIHYYSSFRFDKLGRYIYQNALLNAYHSNYKWVCVLVM